MSANLDTKADGTAAMVYVGDRITPWHKDGTAIADVDSRDLDLAIQHGGIGFPIEKVSHYVMIPCRSNAKHAIEMEPGKFYRPAKSEDGYSILRTDTNKVIGTVGETYTVLPNEDAWAPIRPILEEGLANIETAGSLRGGKQTWMMLRFDSEAIIAAAAKMVGSDATVANVTKGQVAALEDTFHNERGEGFLPYGLLTGDHTGKRKATMKETGVCVVCQNTLDWSLNQTEGGISIAVPHIKSVREDWRQATESLFGDLVQRFLSLANYRAIMKAKILDGPSFIDLVLEACYPVKHLEEKIQRRDGSAFTVTSLEKSGEKRNRITDLWENGAGHTGDHSAWEAYQGAVEFLDHDTEALPSNGNRVQSLMDGSLKKAKSKVFRGLLDYSVGSEESRDVVAEMLHGTDTREITASLLASNAAR